MGANWPNIDPAVSPIPPNTSPNLVLYPNFSSIPKSVPIKDSKGEAAVFNVATPKSLSPLPNPVSLNFLPVSFSKAPPRKYCGTP